MIIDFHAHVFPDKIADKTVKLLAEKGGVTPYGSATVDGLNQSVKKAGVDIAVALPVLTKPEQFESVLNFARLINEKFAGKVPQIVSFAGIHPHCENIPEKMQTIKQLGFKGVKIHPDYQDAFIDDSGYMEIISMAKELDLIVITHAGVDVAYRDKPVRCPPKLARKVIEKIGHEKLVLAHYGGNEMYSEVYDELAGLNVYFDTAFMLSNIREETFIKILNKHGEDKILFASDYPWSDMERDIKILNSFSLTDKQKDKIFYENAVKLLEI